MKELDQLVETGKVYGLLQSWAITVQNVQVRFKCSHVLWLFSSAERPRFFVCQGCVPGSLANCRTGIPLG